MNHEGTKNTKEEGRRKKKKEGVKLGNFYF
jgi:hypothetical protein